MKVIIIVILLGINHHVLGQKINYPRYNIDSIYLVLLKDTGNNSEGIKAWIRSYADSIKSYGNNKDTYFPYRTFNKVRIYRRNEAYLTLRKNRTVIEPIDSNKCYFLNTKDINTLLEIINNPTYFEFAECGTAITQYEFQFLNGVNVVETLSVACSERQLKTNSAIKDMNWQRMKYGAIKDDNALKRLQKILMNCGAYFEAKN
jgi:hypothetical protein